MNRTAKELIDEYDRYLASSPNLSEQARLSLAERIINQMRRST